MSLAARDSEFRRWSGRVDRRICQTFAASPAEPGELPLGFRAHFPDYTFLGSWANAQAKWANLDSKLPLEAKQAGTHPRKDDLR
jgi:hypothetical protein